MRRWIVVVLGLVLVGLFLMRNDISSWLNQPGRSSTGEIIKAGELDAAGLRIGDCYDHAEATAGSVETVLARPCAEPHAFEVFATGEMPDGDYPTMAAFERFADATCTSAFSSYVGITYDSSTLGIMWLYPGEEKWPGDRTIHCSLYDPQSSRLTGSLKDGER